MCVVRGSPGTRVRRWDRDRRRTWQRCGAPGPAAHRRDDRPASIATNPSAVRPPPRTSEHGVPTAVAPTLTSDLSAVCRRRTPMTAVVVASLAIVAGLGLLT